MIQTIFGRYYLIQVNVKLVHQAQIQFVDLVLGLTKQRLITLIIGLLPVKLTTKDDHKLNEYGLGVTCLCQRATSSTAELSDDEWKQGKIILHDF